MQKYPIGIQDFAKLRQDGYLYIDKTGSIHELIKSGSYYFLSRPRRFGKSLLLSTIKYLFLGKKELFEGLAIENQWDNWQSHPVLHFSFSTLGYQDLGLERALNQAIEIAAEKVGFQLTHEGLGPRFQQLIQHVGGGAQKLVLLIDEYDKPLVDYIHDIPQAEKNRDILKNFFSVIKDADAYLRFFLITGVSKFSKVSLFSDLNHLRDITLVRQFGTIAGYTQEELDHHFETEMKALSQVRGETVEDLRAEIKDWYNGYSWDRETRLYNPFSILNFFASQEFANFWWETGTPTFLIQKLKRGFHYQLESLDAGSDLFESYTLENMEWKSLLFQTGYLTIHHYDPDLRLYTLGYPNREVRDSMYRHLLAAFREGEKSDSQPLLAYIRRALEAYDLERLIGLIDTLFSTILHQLFLQKQAAFFHAVLHLTFQAMGLLTQSEVSTAKGRVDTIVHTGKHIYVIEFKLDAAAAEALDQIRTRRYGSACLGKGKEVIALGISFSSQTKTVAGWKALPYEELLMEE